MAVVRQTALSSRTTAGTATSFTHTLHASSLTDDWLVACVDNRGTAFTGTPSGWTQVGTTRVFLYRVQASDVPGTTTFTWTWGGAGVNAAYWVDYFRGGGATAPLTADSGGGVTGTAQTVPTVSSVPAGSAALYLAYANSSQWTVSAGPTGWTLIQDLQSASSSTNAEIAGWEQTSPGTTVGGDAWTEAGTTPTAGTFGVTVVVVPSGPATVSGVAALSSGSTLTVAADVTELGVAPLSSSAVLTAAAIVTELGVANLGSTASLLAAADRTTFGAAALSSTVALGASAGGIASGVAPLSLSSSLSVAAVRGVVGAVSLPSAASLVVSGLRTALAAAALSSGSTLAVTATVTRIGQASLVSVSTMTIAAIAEARAAAALSVLVSMGVVGTVVAFDDGDSLALVGRLLPPDINAKLIGDLVATVGHPDLLVRLV